MIDVRLNLLTRISGPCALEKKVVDTRDILRKLGSKKETGFHTFIKQKNLSIGMQLLKPGQKYGDQHHNHDEIYYIVQGDGYIQLGKNAKKLKVRSGMIFACPHGVEHTFSGNKKNIIILYIFRGEDN